jgi:hypothetical protein
LAGSSKLCKLVEIISAVAGVLLQLSVKERHTTEQAQAQAMDARQRAEDAVIEKNALKETLERQITILEDKCESLSKTQQQEQERLESYWHKRLSKMEAEYSKKHAKQAAETNNIREECSVAMSRVLPAPKELEHSLFVAQLNTVFMMSIDMHCTGLLA